MSSEDKHSYTETTTTTTTTTVSSKDKMENNDLKSDEFIIKPRSNAVVGVLGGGQLGRMMIEAANPLNIPVLYLDKSACSASLVTGIEGHVEGNFTNHKDILELAAKVDVLTVEIEHVNVNSLIDAQEKYPSLRIYPTPECISIIQDKYKQKLFLKNTSSLISDSVPSPLFNDLRSGYEISDIKHIAENLGYGYPIMLKSKKLAYDGRGNYIIKNENDIKKAIESLTPPNFKTTLESSHLYVEKMVPFIKELAVMVSVSTTGEIKCYPAVETIQKNNICQYVIAPAQVSIDILQNAVTIASNAVRKFNSPGIFGVELFLLKDNTILLNEIAPRPHNSGHYTMNACFTSQFQQHLRCILGLPLGSTRMITPAAIMVNLIGEHNEQSLCKKSILDICSQSLAIEGASVHLYGKKEYKLGRKMGHLNFIGESLENIVELIVNKVPSLYELINIINPSPVIGIIMGSDSDLPTLKPCAELLKSFGIKFELTIVSAHRTPQRLFDYAQTAHKRGIKVIIAAAGGAAHLPGMVAAMSPLPVIGVPVALKYLDGVDSLYSIVQMPKGVPVATVAINNSTNAALLAARIIGSNKISIQNKVIKYKEEQENIVMKKIDNLNNKGWEDY